MRKKLYLIKTILSVFLLFFSTYPLYAQLNPLMGKEQATLPNPMELSSSWWDYYNVESSQQLAEKKKATEELFQSIQSQLPYEARVRLQPSFDRVLIQLQALIDSKSQQAQPFVPIDISKNPKTFETWVSLIPLLLKKQRELDFQKVQLDLTKSSLKSGGRYLDAQFSAYLKESPDSAIKLEDGLKIMQARISLAIEKTQISNLNDSIEIKRKQLADLMKEMKLFFDQINFEATPPDLFQSKLQETKEAQNSNYTSFFLAYETAMASEVESKMLADQRMIAARMRYEIARTQTMRFEILQMIIGIEQKNKNLTGKGIGEQIERWKVAITEIEHEIPNWEASSEAVLEKSLSGISQPAKEVAEESILSLQKLSDEIFINRYLLDTLSDVRHRTAFGFFGTLYLWWKGFVEFIKKQAGWFNQSLFKIGELPITPWGLLKVVIVLVCFYFAGKITSRGIIYFGSKQRTITKTSVYVFSKLSYYSMIILGIIISVFVLGLDLTILGYIAGAFAIWIGLSLQSIFHNFISGIIVLLTKMIRINDLLELESGEKGFVTAINLRTTIIQTLQGSELIVPNSEFVGKKFINHSLFNYVKRVHIPFRIALNEDRERICKIAIEAAKKVSITSESKEPEVWLLGYEDNYVKMELVVWVNSYLVGTLAARDPQYFWALDTALRENNIKIPVPQRIVTLKDEKEPKP